MEQGKNKFDFLIELTEQCHTDWDVKDANETTAKLSVEDAASLIYNIDLSMRQYQVLKN